MIGPSCQIQKQKHKQSHQVITCAKLLINFINFYVFFSLNTNHILYFINQMKSQSYFKTIFIILLIATLATAYTFEQFKHNFQKKYTPSQESKRRQSFNKNNQYLLQMQRQGIHIPPNEHMDKDSSQLRALTGLKKPKIQNIGQKNKKEVRKLRSSRSVAPIEFDYRKLKKVSKIKNQQQCGACWAFAVVAYYESLYLQAYSQQKDLSQQFVLQCTQKGTCAQGGWPIDAVETIQDKGIPQEKTFQYQAKDYYYTYSEICMSKQPFIKIHDRLLTNRYDKNKYTLQQLKQLLVDKGPLMVGVQSNRTNFMYPTADGFIYNCPQNPDIDHVVLLVGYTESHWIIKNSWGTTWGQNGYGYLQFNKDCGVLQNVFITQFDLNLDEDEQSEYINLKIHMSDRFGDGWANTILAFKQNNKYVATFGKNFIRGWEFVEEIIIQNNIETQIVVYQKGDWTNEVGFIVYQGQEIIYQRKKGKQFQKNQVFHTFQKSQKNQVQTYQIILRDSYGDGWGGNTIVISQGKNSYQVGQLFKSNAIFGPIFLNFTLNQQIIIKPGVVTQYTQQIGYEIRNHQGFEIIQRKSGKPYHAGDILNSYKHGMINLLPVKDLTSSISKQKQTNQVEHRQIIEHQANSQKYFVFIIFILSLAVTTLAVSLCLIWRRLQILLRQGISNKEKRKVA